MRPDEWKVRNGHWVVVVVVVAVVVVVVLVSVPAKC